MCLIIKNLLIKSLIFSAVVHGLKVTFERAQITYANPKYLESAFLNVTRYTRKGDYYMNLDITLKYFATNNGTFHIYLFEYTRNQYKRSFIEFHQKMCDLILDNVSIRKVLGKAGLTCPIAAGKYQLMNVTVNYDNFPNVFPFEKGRIDVYFNASADGEPILRAEAYITFKNELRKQKKG